MLHVLIARKQRTEVKVSQVAGAIAEATSYHHGEASLVETIVGMAQTHVGTNNVNLLRPDGQFGSRLAKPSVHAQPRYISTALENITTAIFRPEDVPLLKLRREEGRNLEPEHFLPVIPMVLVNGAAGIGTGWMTDVPSFHPLRVADAVEALVQSAAAGRLMDSAAEDDAVADALWDDLFAGEAEGAPDEKHVAPAAAPATAPAEEGVDAAGNLLPWFAGFCGSVQAEGLGTYLVSGVWSRSPGEDEDSEVVEITELPVGRWTDDFVSDLTKRFVIGGDKAGPDAFVRTFSNLSTESTVHLRLECDAGKLAMVDANPGGLARALGLRSKVRTTNMWLFDEKPRLRKFGDPAAIVRSFFDWRRPFYALRHQRQDAELSAQRGTLRNQRAFVAGVIDGSIVLHGKSAEALDAHLAAVGLERQPPAASSGTPDAPAQASFDYLLRMHMSSLTQERVRGLEGDIAATEAKLEELRSKTPLDLWRADLSDFRAAYRSFESDRADRVRKAEAYAAAAAAAGATRPTKRKGRIP